MRGGMIPWRGVWRQSRVDAAPLGVEFVVIAFAAFLAAIVPQEITTVETSQLQADVAEPGAHVDIVVSVPLRDEIYELAPATADSAEWVGGLVDDGMPADLRAVLAPPVTTIAGHELKAGQIANRPGRARFIYVASENGPAVEWLSGRVPTSTGEPLDLQDAENGVLPIEVAVSEATAAVLGIHAGDTIAVDSELEVPLDVRVTGVYRATNPADAAWRAEPRLLEPQLVDGSAAVAVVGLMVSEKSLPFARLAVFPRSMTRTYTYTMVPSMLNAGNVADVATQARALASGKQVFGNLGSDVRVTTGLDAVLGDVLSRVDAAAAQASILLIAVLSVSVAVLLLASRLVVNRRAVVLALWRSRGATLAAIGVVAFAESIPIVALGGTVGVVAARLAAHGETPWAWVVPPLLLAAFAPPILAVSVAARQSEHAHSPLRRRNRIATAKVRRIAGEALLVIAAVGSLAALRVRGVGASAGSVWSDIAVLAAPVLVAVSVVVLLLRVQPRMLRFARSASAGLRGVVLLLAAARAKATGMATAALVLAGAAGTLAVSLSITVNQAQAMAAWDAVGADVAVTTDAQHGLPERIGALDGNAGVTVAEASLVTGAQVIGSGVDDRVDLVIVDVDAMSRLAAAAPAAGWSSVDALANGQRSDGTVAVMVAGAASDWSGATLRWGDDSVAMNVVGSVRVLPRQLVSDQPRVIVDRATLVQAIGHDIPANAAWAAGPGADTLVSQAVADAHGGSDMIVVTREGWLVEQRQAPIARALAWLLVGAGTASVLLSVLAVMLMAASGSSDRIRSVARMRVVGAPRRAAHRVAWLEVAIPVVASSMVGVLTGWGLARLLVAPLALESLTEVGATLPSSRRGGRLPWPSPWAPSRGQA